MSTPARAAEFDAARTNMWRIAGRNALTHRARLAMTFVMVVLGATFVAGSMLFGDSINVIPGVIRDDVAVLVAPEGETDPGGEGGAGTRIRTDQVRQLAALPGVAKANGVVTGYAAVVGTDGKIARGTGFGSGLTGTNWDDNDTGRLRLLHGRAPQHMGEVAVETTVAGNAGLEVGDTARVLNTDGARTATVVGIFAFRVLVLTGPGGGPAVAFDTVTAQELLLEPGAFSEVELTAQPGADVHALLADAAEAAPDGFEALDGANLARQSHQQAEGDADFSRWIGLSFTLVALAVGVSLITNTFSMLLTQRTRELALLRAVGATRAQVRRWILFEAATIGATASVVGLATGAGLAAPLVRYGGSVDPTIGASLRVTPLAVLTTVVAGVGIPVLAAWLPARRAAAMPPVTALRGQADHEPRGLRLRIIAGTSLALPAAGLCVLGTMGTAAGFIVAAVTGLLLLLAAAVVLSPVLTRPLLRLVGTPARRRVGIGALATRNALRDPRRTGATVSALLVGTALLTGVNVFAATVSEAGAGAARRLLSAELVAANITGGHIGTRLQQQVAALPGVAAATTVPTAPVEIDGEQETAAAVVPRALGTLLTPDLRHGRAEDLAAGMFVEDDLARRHGWSLGAAVRLSSHQGRPLTLTITGIYRDASTPLAGGLGLPALLVSDTVAAQHFPPEATGDALLVAATPDADRAALRRDLEAAVADRPDVQVLTTTDYIDGRLGELTSFVRILNGMLAVALLIAFLGIVNTMALSVVERTREIGLLRALGMLRGQVRTMVLIESVLITITGVLVGLGIGMAAGGLTQRAVLGRPAIDLIVPASTIAVTVLALAAAGALAAAWPARHAARTDMLQALTTE